MANVERALASIRRISDIQPIEGADKICVYTVDGWKVVDSIDKYQIGDLVVYIEPDSFVPTEVAPFLSKGKEPHEFNGIKGERLRTIRLRGQISQGLILPITNDIEMGYHYSQVQHGDIQEMYIESLNEGTDVTALLQIQKYEAPVEPQLSGLARGNFPVDIPRTDQTRIQNLKRNFKKEVTPYQYEVTEKLHGTSATFYLSPEGEFIVCSRNINLKEEEGNLYWKIARELDIERKLREQIEGSGVSNFGLAIQGEIVGPGINGNQYELTSHKFYVFDIIVVDRNDGDAWYLSPEDRHHAAGALKLNHVPIISVSADTYDDYDYALETMLKYADGISAINNSKREGVVFKRIGTIDVKIAMQSVVSFKVVSNEWLLENE